MTPTSSSEEQVVVVCVAEPNVNAHKYSRGKLIVCGGSKAYPGAVCMSAWASQYMGAGYTEVFTDSSHLGLIQSTRPSLVVRSFEEFEPNTITYNNPVALVVGPGFDKNDSLARVQTMKALEYFEESLLLDGGALAQLCQKDTLVLLMQRKKAGFNTVLTPHGGEAHRLARSLSIPEVNSMQLARDLSLACGAVVVLKGSQTIISNGISYAVVSHGSAALAKAGTGDVLAGMIGALLAQGADCFSAAVRGVSLHADAGNCAAERYGMVSVCAEEVICAIPDAIRTAATASRSIPIYQHENG